MPHRAGAISAAVLAPLLPLLYAIALGAAGDSQSATPVDYYRDIRPIFAERCYGCHGPDRQESQFRLDLKDKAMAGGVIGPPVVPGKAQDSYLYKFVSGLDPDMPMPPEGPRLTERQVDLIRQWIDSGAPWPDPPAGYVVGADHWAFKPPVRPAVPQVANSAWVATPVDAFIAAEHAKRGLAPAPEADRATLIRRLSLDLTGLPPSPEEVRAFLADTSPDAYQRLVERLLASPHYGERWGRHWLDLARWAESDAYEANRVRDTSWHYRDYVIRSFNQDKPYDLFLRQQIAGDELVPYSDENLIATGFLAGGRLNNNEEDKAVQRNNMLVDITNATAIATLGLSLNCAQCHDHKFDPLSAKDYYRFQGFFVQGQVNFLLLKDEAAWKEYQAGIPPELEVARELRSLVYEPARQRLVAEARRKLTDEQRAALDTPEAQRTPEQQRLARDAARAIEVRRDNVLKALSEDDRRLLTELDKKISGIESSLQGRKPQTWAYYSPVTSPHQIDNLPPRGQYPLPYDRNALRQAVPRLLNRGDPASPGERLEPGWPAILGPTPPRAEGQTPRMQLVDWLVSAENPLTTRVWVNFVWQQHLGRGIVATSGDFGTRGAKPSHSELLDWLATEFVRGGWSTKHIHRLIVLSSTYRQASAPHDANAAIDPDNVYLWRWTPRRLEAEAIRDCILTVSGELDRTLGGPSIPADQEHRSFRRAVYLLQQRNLLPDVQRLFDAPTANEACPQRYTTNVPLQPLYLLNNPFYLERAMKLAQRVVQSAGDDPLLQIQTAFLLALGRDPQPAELSAAEQFMQTQGGEAAGAGRPTTRLVHFCHALFNLNEFLHLQ